MINYIYVFPYYDGIVEIPTKPQIHPLILIANYLFSIDYPEHKIFHFCSEQYFTRENPYYDSKTLWFKTDLDTINIALSGKETNIAIELNCVPEDYKKLLQLELLLR